MQNTTLAGGRGPTSSATQWKAQVRADILRRRQAIADSDRRLWNAEITRLLLQHFPQLASMTIGLYWPYMGEFDPRHAVYRWRKQGAVAALPEVVRKGAPLQFRAWWPGVAMGRGVYDIPIPLETDIVVPDALLIPPVGFDAAGYRIGYGGGFYDRTLAGLHPRPLTIGVAYELSRLDSIDPQEHDIPVDWLVTQNGVFRCGV